MLRVVINGQPREFAPGITILDALRTMEVEIPTLCHDERLVPCGACRVCVVQRTGWARPETACNTPLADGMEIQTHTPELEQLRRTLFTLLARQYPADAFHRFPEKQFHRYLRAYGLEAELRGARRPECVDDSHPYLHVDMSQCVTCYRCVRICEEVQGQFTWRVWHRGEATRILPDSGTTLLESSCVSCGACADACPSGALEDKTVLAQGVPTAWTRTTCAYCGVGCEMQVGTRDHQIVTIRPARDAPVNKGHLCVKGRYAFTFTHASDRITEPMIRHHGAWKKVSWEEAIEWVADRLGQIVVRHGPDSVGVLGSSRATNEENYLAQKFARVVLGTNNVDCCARVCHAPSAAALRQTLGTGAATSSLDDIERARTILLCGANATENHPIAGARIKQAVRRGARLIVVDPRQIELAHYAECHLALRPGTNVPLLNALACAMVDERLCDEIALRDRVSDADEFEKFIRAFAPEKVAPLCGVEAGLIRRAARLYAAEKPAISFHGLGLTEHTQGTDAVICLVNLALLTGNFGKPGTGVNPLRGQNNVQGAAHMGCEPGNLTGFVPLADGQARFAQAWQTPVPATKGFDLLQMLDAARGGRLKALWAIGYDLLLTSPNAEDTRRALQSLELVVVQDMFLNELAHECGSVFLPAASSFEKDGTFMNGERRIQRVRKAIEPVGHSRSDWEIIRDVARAMGGGRHFDFRSAREIWDEVRSLWKVGQGISYDRIESHGLQWPCPSEQHPGTALLHVTSFPTGPRAALRCIDFEATAETTSPEFPFLLTTGRCLFQFNAGTMTLRSANRLLRPTDKLDISVEDARRLNLQEGEPVRLRSRHGETAIEIQINPAMKSGELFATFHTREVFLNLVTSPHHDHQTRTPEFKVTAVRIERLR